MMLTRIVSKPRTDLRTIAILWNPVLDQTKLRIRFQKMRKRLWKIRSRKLSVGWTRIKLQRKRSLKRSRRREAELGVCQALCPEECLTWVVCQIWVVLEEL